MNPSAAEDVNLASVVPFHELNLDPDSVECQKYSGKLIRFYFGMLPISEETIHVYLHVNYFNYTLRNSC